jgi:hypothetical protein
MFPIFSSRNYGIWVTDMVRNKKSTCAGALVAQERDSEDSFEDSQWLIDDYCMVKTESYKTAFQILTDSFSCVTDVA